MSAWDEYLKGLSCYNNHESSDIVKKYCYKEKEEKDIEELVQDDDGDIQMDMNQDDDGENNEQGEEEQEGNNEEAGVIDFTFLNFSFYQFVLGVILCSNWL